MFRLNCINSQKWSNIIYFMVYHLQPIFILMLAYYNYAVLCRIHVNKCNEMHKMCHTFCASVIFHIWNEMIPSLLPMGRLFYEELMHYSLVCSLYLIRIVTWCAMWCEEKRKLNLNFPVKDDEDNKIIFELEQ